MFDILITPIAPYQVMAGLKTPAYTEAIHAHPSVAISLRAVIENNLNRLLWILINQFIRLACLSQGKGLAYETSRLNLPQHIPGKPQPPNLLPAPRQFRGQSTYLGTDQFYSAAMIERSQIQLN
jgi:hypothetical protein